MEAGDSKMLSDFSNLSKVTNWVQSCKLETQIRDERFSSGVKIESWYLFTFQYVPLISVDKNPHL